MITNEQAALLAAAAAVGAFVPKMLTRFGIKVPEFLQPDLAAPGKSPAQIAKDAFTAVVPRGFSSPLPDLHAYVAQAAAGIRQLSPADVQVVRAIKTQCDLILAGEAGKPAGPSLTDINPPQKGVL